MRTIKIIKIIEIHFSQINISFSKLLIKKFHNCRIAKEQFIRNKIESK